MINRVELTGRIYQAELRQTRNNNSVFNARIGVRDMRDKAMTFVDLVFWHTLAERASDLLSADDRTRVTIVGSLQQDKWTNDAGEPRTKLSVKVKRFFVLMETQAPEDTMDGMMSNLEKTKRIEWEEEM
jgi:single-stranded DNA-binding protein